MKNKILEKLLVKPIELTDKNKLVLYPAKGAEDLIVYVKRSSFERISYYVNIAGGLVIMGLDKNRILKDIEFNFPRNKWKEEKDIVIPTKYTPANMEFINVVERSNELDLPVLARTDRSRSAVEFFWGARKFDSQIIWYALSNQCFALICENLFRGFLVKLL